MTNLDENAAAQRDLYGAPLGELCHEVMAAIGLTQARLADVLGISAPMLSQLMSAKRVKIGNPSAVARLQSLLDLVPSAAGLAPGDLTSRVDAIRESSTTLTSSRATETLTGALRALATADELRAASSAVDGTVLGRVLAEAADG